MGDKSKAEYFFVDTGAPGFDRLVIQLRNKQTETWPRNKLSVRYSRDGTMALVKCGGIPSRTVTDESIQSKTDVAPHLDTDIVVGAW